MRIPKEKVYFGLNNVSKCGRMPLRTSVSKMCWF